VGGVVKYFFRSFKASCASLVHWNLSYFLSCLKKGSPLKPSCEMNLLKEAIDIMDTLEWQHLSDSRHLIWVKVDSTLGDHIPE
jgi:hypothetical protein